MVSPWPVPLPTALVVKKWLFGNHQGPRRQGVCFIEGEGVHGPIPKARPSDENDWEGSAYFTFDTDDGMQHYSMEYPT